MQQFYINVTKSRFDDLNAYYRRYRPTRISLADMRLAFVRKTADDNMVGTDHGYYHEAIVNNIMIV